MRPAALLALALVSGWCGYASAQPCCGDRYYLLLFAGQREPCNPCTSHSWAVYVRVEPRLDDSLRLEPVVISWLPQTLRVRVLAVRSEPGRNLDLAETFAYMAGPRRRITLWGPYEIDARRFREAVAQRERLESGAVRYRTISLYAFDDRIQYCQRAVAATHPDIEGRHRIPCGWAECDTGPYAADLVARGVARLPAGNVDWLLPALAIPTDGLHRRAP